MIKLKKMIKSKKEKQQYLRHTGFRQKILFFRLNSKNNNRRYEIFIESSCHCFVFAIEYR